jgi:hypothetical protein
MVGMAGVADAAVSEFSRALGGSIEELEAFVGPNRSGIAGGGARSPAPRAHPGIELGPEPVNAATGSPSSPSVNTEQNTEHEPTILAATAGSAEAVRHSALLPSERPSSRWRATNTAWVPPDPSELRRCEDVYVYIVSDWIDGGAMATVGLGAKSRGYPKRVGARVGKYRVAAIGAHPHGLGPTVWLTDEGQTCTALLFDDNPTRVSAAAKRRLARDKAKRNKKKRKRKR